MADEDNFDIDIYGDGGEEYQEEGQLQDASSTTERAVDTSMQDSSNVDYNNQDYDEQNHPAPDTSLPKPPIPPQGAKRKDGPDSRPVDPGATNALFVGELSWWTTDDEIRGWAKESGCEDEMKEVTFHEQKVNGKSKGQVYLLFDTPQASTAAKHKIDHYSETGKYRTKFTVSYTNPLQNPFKTLPKDGPARNNNRTNSGNFERGNHQGGFNSNYRGRGRGNNFNAGGAGGFNRGGFQGGANNFNNNQMGGAGFSAGNMGGMQNFGGAAPYRGGFQGGRGGNMGMRGGRGGAGMQPNMGMGMPMAGGMMPNMGMAMPMAGGMGMPGGFQGAYNPGFAYPQGSPGADPSWTGGPNKRARQE